MEQQKRGVGRKPKLWDDKDKQTFISCCSIFCTRDEVCSILHMDKRTLEKNIELAFPETPTWQEAFEFFSGSGKASLRRAQFELALSGNVPMLIFLGKNYLNQSDRQAAPAEQPKKAEVRAIDGFRSRSPVAKKAAGE